MEGSVIRFPANHLNDIGVDQEPFSLSNFAFNGQWNDVVSNLYYLRNRYYDCFAGRFITNDPLGVWGDEENMGGAKSYCSSNPITRFDPTGNSPTGVPSNCKEAMRELNLAFTRLIEECCIGTNFGFDDPEYDSHKSDADEKNPRKYPRMRRSFVYGWDRYLLAAIDVSNLCGGTINKDTTVDDWASHRRNL